MRLSPHVGPEQLPAVPRLAVLVHSSSTSSTKPAAVASKRERGTRPGPGCPAVRMRTMLRGLVESVQQERGAAGSISIEPGPHDGNARALVRRDLNGMHLSDAPEAVLSRLAR